MVLSPFLCDGVVGLPSQYLISEGLGFSPMGETGEGSNEKRSQDVTSTRPFFLLWYNAKQN